MTQSDQFQARAQVNAHTHTHTKGEGGGLQSQSRVLRWAETTLHRCTRPLSLPPYHWLTTTSSCVRDHKRCCQTESPCYDGGGGPHRLCGGLPQGEGGDVDVRVLLLGGGGRTEDGQACANGEAQDSLSVQATRSLCPLTQHNMPSWSLVSQGALGGGVTVLVDRCARG